MNKITSHIVKRIFTNFESPYGNLPIKEFINKSINIEQDIQKLVVECILLFISDKYKSYRHIDEDKFQINKGIYHLKIGQRIQEPTLEFGLFNDIVKDGNIIEDEIEINGSGYYSKIHFMLDKDFISDSDTLKTIVGNVYDSTYEWLHDTVLEYVEQLEKNNTFDLYKTINALLITSDKVSLKNQFYFGLHRGDTGYYVLNRETSLSIVDKLSLRKYRSYKSPLYHFLNLIGLPVLYSKSMARNAIEKGRQIHVALPKAQYKLDQPDYLKTEEQMVDGGKMTIFPLINDEKCKLLICFASKYKNDFIPIIKANTDVINMSFQNNTESIFSYLEDLKKSFKGINWNAIGDFSGGFVGGLIKSFHQS